MATGKPPTGTPMSKELACIQYSTSERVPVIEPSALDSSKDGVLFAVGVSKRVYVYNFQDVVRLSPSKVVPPLINTKSESQVRSLCFSDRKEQNVIFGDNQGQLYCLKDSRIHAPSQNQHAEAVRSICTNQHGQLVLSGSEDKTVKVWCASSLRNIYTKETVSYPVSVCAHPSEAHIFAYATRSNIVGVDLRNPKMDLFKIHTSDKPFSYVEFISSKEIVTRTDGSVQLWDLESKHIVRGFTSPYEKLTGTKVFDGMIACGNDSNSVLIFEKDWLFPRMSHKFKTTLHQSEDDLPDSVQMFLKTLPWWNPNKATSLEYISSICWKDNNHVIAACTGGYLYLLKIYLDN